MSEFSQESTDAVLQMMRWEGDSCFPLQLPPMSPAELKDPSRECGRTSTSNSRIVLATSVAKLLCCFEEERSCLHTLYSRELKPSIKKNSKNIGLESEQR